MEKLSELKNLGPESERLLNSVGIYSRKDIIEFGPANIYQLLKKQGFDVTMVMAYSLQGAIMDIHWNKLPFEVKEQLRIDCKVGG